MIQNDGDIFISIAEADERNIAYNGDTLLYCDNLRFGFDSCDLMKFNNIKGREHEFYIKLP